MYHLNFIIIIIKEKIVNIVLHIFGNVKIENK